MQIYGAGSTADKQEDTGVNANANSLTTSLKMNDANTAGLYVVSNTGTHSSHVVTLQVSPDNTNWFDTAHTITGVGNLHDINCISEYVRVKVTTLQGATSTVDITIIIK